MLGAHGYCHCETLYITLNESGLIQFAHNQGVLVMRTAILLAIVLAFPVIAMSATIHVPADQPTIQDGIDAAVDGDTVLVSPGAYVENINFEGKAITLKSSDGPDVTTIDGSNTNSVVVFNQGEGSDSVLEGFTITNGFGDYYKFTNAGGGILCIDSSPTMVNNKITDNFSYWGGGICFWGSGTTPALLDCVVSGNDVPSAGGGRGGGILCYGSNALISGCTIKENSCEHIGGGISAHNSCSPIIVNNLIDSNTALSAGSGFGGGFGCSNGVSPIIRNNIITNNKSHEGGGLCVWMGEVTNNIIMYNEAARDLDPNFTTGSGGGIAVLSTTYPIIVKDNYIAYNTALASGGGVEWGRVEGEFEGNVVCFNGAYGATYPNMIKKGGGLYIYYFGTNKFENNIIYSNYAEDYGGGVYINWANGYVVDVTLTNFTITKNSSPCGSGIYCKDYAELTVSNSIIWGNSGIEVEYEQTVPNITYSDVKGGWPGTGNIDSDPMFVDPDNDDYHIYHHSPCRDTGDNRAPHLTEQDFEGDPRIAEGTVDMGADEFYKHLYFIDGETPEGDIDVKFVDIPGTAPIGLWVGTSVFDDPINGSYGDWYIRPPFLFWGPFQPIPSPGGVQIISGDIPLSPAPPYKIYLQAIIGNKLTNLCEINVQKPSLMVQIPAGEFEMGDHFGVGDHDELPVHTVYIDSFYMDIYEVTNQKYCDYLNSAYSQGVIEVNGGIVYKKGDSEPYCGTTPSSSYSRITWNGSTFGITAGKEYHPMLMVSWYGAAAYANWRSEQAGLTPCYDLDTWECNFGADGYRLPTEAEWEYAARGGEYYYKYPWGDNIDGSKANYTISGDPFETGPYPWTTPAGYYDGNQIPAGLDMANGFGLYDMAGNVFEWCNDWYHDDYYSSSPYNNPHGPSSGSDRVVRSFGWSSSGGTLRCANRQNRYPGDMFNHYGFRLALEIP